MREYGPMFVVLDGDKQRAQQYVSIARTMLGRMKAYLGEGVDGVKTWTLDNGVSIRTLTAGGVDKVTIHAPHEEVTTRKGYYFVYLFGSFTDESAKAYGWRIERDTDKVTPIKGMPFELFNNADNPGASVIAPPAGGRVRCSADNHGHNSEIVVLANVYPDNFSSTATPDHSTVIVFNADTKTGTLSFKSALTSDVPLFDSTALDVYYSTSVYAAQSPSKYIIRSNDYLIVNFAGSEPARHANRAFLFDTNENTLTYFDDEESTDGAVRTNSYAIRRVGMSAHHPTKKIFYTAFTRFLSESFSASLPNDTIFRAYSYTEVDDPPTMISEFSIRVIDVFLTPTAIAVTEDGGSLVCLTQSPGGAFTWHTLDADGQFAGGHWFNDLLTNPALDLTAADWREQYFSRTRYASGSPYFEGNIVTLKAGGDTPGSFAFNTFTEPDSATTPISTGALSFLRMRSDDLSQGLVLSGSETYDRRKANSCVRTLDGKRLFRSVGRQADVVGGSYSYIDVPRLFSHKFVHEPGAPWYVPTELKRVDIPLASAGDVTNMAKTDRLSGIAIFEPMEGR